MKYIQFVIMAVLIFGVAVSPIFSNGFAFAQTDEEVNAEQTESTATSNATSTQEERISEAEQRESVREQKASEAANREATRDDRAAEAENREATRDAMPGTQAYNRQVAGEDRASAEERRAASIEEKRQISEERRAISDERRQANMEAHKAKLADKFANLSEDHRQLLEDRLEAMQYKHDKRNSDQPSIQWVDMTEEERQIRIDETKENRLAKREARMNMTVEEKQALREEKQAQLLDRRENYVSPRDQFGLGIPTDEIICGEGKELVIKVSSGVPTCLGPEATIILMDRGIVAYPE